MDAIRVGYRERFLREMEAVKRSGKCGGVGIIPGVTGFGMSKNRALPCDQDSGVNATGWRKDMDILKTWGAWRLSVGLTMCRRSGGPMRRSAVRFAMGHIQGKKGQWPASFSPGYASWASPLISLET